MLRGRMGHLPLARALQSISKRLTIGLPYKLVTPAVINENNEI